MVTNDLVVRSLPEISAESIIDPIMLSEGKLLFVLNGPVAADGFDWYRVAPFDEFLSDIASEAPRLGWVAAGKDGEIWIAPWMGECPAPTLEEIRWRWSSLRVACFGDDELTLEGTIGECSYTVPGTISPEWLANFHCPLLPFDFEEGPFGGLPIHREDQTTGIQDVGVAVRVVGHFDHSAARTCIEHALEGEEPTPPELLILYCRGEFVMTDITEIARPS